MFACTRSLMNRPSRSSTNSSPHIMCSSDDSAIFDPASSRSSRARAAKTDETECRLSSRINRINSGFGYGTPRTYQLADGSSSTAPPAAHSTIWATQPLQDPQPLPARGAAITPVTDFSPPRTVSTIVAFCTPLQLQTCASSDNSAAPTATSGVPMSNISEMRSSVSGSPRSKACIKNATLLTSPTRVAPTSLLSRTTTVLYTPCFGSLYCTNSSSSCSGAFSPIAATSTPATLSLVAMREPWYAARGLTPVMQSASTVACSHSGATRP